MFDETKPGNAESVEGVSMNDVTDEWTPAICAAPVNHKLYATAQEMVSNRYSKASLVRLVHWLLVERSGMEEECRSCCVKINEMNDVCNRIQTERDAALRDSARLHKTVTDLEGQLKDTFAKLTDEGDLLDASLARAEAAEASRTELMRLLESLTPGGSEFHNDPKTCAEWIQSRGDFAKQQIIKRREAEAENARLREVLAWNDCHKVPPPTNEWVHIAQRLPGCPYERSVARWKEFFYGDGSRFGWFNTDWFELAGVTHWRPFPSVEELETAK